MVRGMNRPRRDLYKAEERDGVAGNVPGARSSRASNGRREAFCRRAPGAYDKALVGISEEVLDGLSGDGHLEEEPARSSGASSDSTGETGACRARSSPRPS